LRASPDNSGRYSPGCMVSDHLEFPAPADDCDRLRTSRPVGFLYSLNTFSSGHPHDHKSTLLQFVIDIGCRSALLVRRHDWRGQRLTMFQAPVADYLDQFDSGEGGCEVAIQIGSVLRDDDEDPHGRSVARESRRLRSLSCGSATVGTAVAPMSPGII
jgi:hypothetical protein